MSAPDLELVVLWPLHRSHYLSVPDIPFPAESEEPMDSERVPDDVGPAPQIAPSPDGELDRGNMLRARALAVQAFGAAHVPQRRIALLLGVTRSVIRRLPEPVPRATIRPHTRAGAGAMLAQILIAQSARHGSTEGERAAALAWVRNGGAPASTTDVIATRSHRKSGGAPTSSTKRTASKRRRVNRVNRVNAVNGVNRLAALHQRILQRCGLMLEHHGRAGVLESRGPGDDCRAALRRHGCRARLWDGAGEGRVSRGPYPSPYPYPWAYPYPYPYPSPSPTPAARAGSLSLPWGVA